MKKEYDIISKAVLSVKPPCVCCLKAKAQDAHLIVRKIDHKYKLDDFIPVCFGCRELLRQAIEDEYISQNEKDFLDIKEKCVNIAHDEEYKKLSEFLNSKHYLSAYEISEIKRLGRLPIEKIKQLTGKKVWYDNLSDFKFYGRQIKQIRKIIQTARYRMDKKS